MTPYLKGDNILNNHHFWYLIYVSFRGCMSKLSCLKKDFPQTNLKKMKENQALEDRIDRNLVCFFWANHGNFLEAGHLFETNMGPGTRLQKDWGKVRESHEFVKIHLMCTASESQTAVLQAWCAYGCFLKWWYPQNTPKWCFLVGKPMVVWYHHFRKTHIHFFFLSLSLPLSLSLSLSLYIQYMFIHTVYAEISRTVDVRNTTNQLSLVVYPIIDRVFREIPGG